MLRTWFGCLVTIGSLAGWLTVHATPVGAREMNEEGDDSSPGAHQRYRLRESGLDHSNPEPEHERASTLRFRVTTDEDDDDCGCHGQAAGSSFGR